MLRISLHRVWLSFSTKESIKLLAVMVQRHFHSSVPPPSSSRLVSRWSTDDLVCQSNEDAPTRMPHDPRLSIVNCYLSSRRFNSSFCVSFSFVSQMSSLPFSCVYICPSVEPSRINESSGTHTIEPSSSPDRYVFYSIEPRAAIVLFVRQSLYDSVWVRRLLFGKMPLASKRHFSDMHQYLNAVAFATSSRFLSFQPKLLQKGT